MVNSHSGVVKVVCDIIINILPLSGCNEEVTALHSDHYVHRLDSTYKLGTHVSAGISSLSTQANWSRMLLR